MPSSSLSSTDNCSTLEYATKEAERFETFYNDVLAMHELLEKIENISLRRQFREIINKIEDDFVADSDFNIPRCSLYNTLRLGVIGGSLSGKSSLTQRFITGTNPTDDVMPGKHKKALNVQGVSHLLLVRDETGPPDVQFSQWADAVLLVFNVIDELSFNVISSYYAKMLQYRKEKELPCILVAVKGVNWDNANGEVADARIKKFISDHHQCPYFLVSVETGENVQEVFYNAAERILQHQTPFCMQYISHTTSCDNLLSQSMPTIDGLSSVATSLVGSTNSLKKIKRRNTLFSLKHDKKEELVLDDIGVGRSIPVKQGYLYKKMQSSIKEWKKKYVIITSDQLFSYYSSMKDYMDDNNAKSIKLIHASVKTPGRRAGVKPSNQGTLQTSFSKSSSSQNLYNIKNVSNYKSPVQSPTKTIQANTSQPIDCFVISNFATTGRNDSSNTSNLSNGSPTICSSGVERSQSDGRDYTNSPSQGIRNAQSYDAFPIKRKNRKKDNRYKSNEVDYQAENDIHSDIDGIVFTPSTPVIKKKSHRKQKSSANLKDLGVEVRNTDYEDDDYVFTIVSMDGKSWDFECSNAEERDSWVHEIESQILKAFQRGESQLSQTEKKSVSSAYGTCIQDRLLALSGNDRCAECNAADPTWASLNLGILICIECSGVHRNLGSHLSRVRSLLLDDWPPEISEVMLLLGNTFVNNLWQCNCKGEKPPTFDSSREERERWISRKYEKKEFMFAPVNTETLSQDIMKCVQLGSCQDCYALIIHSKEKDINTLIDIDGSKLSPLHVSCAKGNISITQLLLWYRADPKILDDRGFNAIFYASKSNSRECADLLFQYGCPEDTPC